MVTPRGGILSGKYDSADLGTVGADQNVAATRREILIANGTLTARNIAIADSARKVAAEIGVSVSQIALAWLLAKPGVVAPVIGARTLEQLIENLGCLSVRLDDEHLAALDAASQVETIFPESLLSRAVIRNLVSGNTLIRGRPHSTGAIRLTRSEQDSLGRLAQPRHTK